MTVLWDWAVAAYARPGVADACLELQDAHGQNVPLLLFAAWTAAEGLHADLDRAAALARTWETTAGANLRAARRNLKPPLDGFDSDAQGRLRAAVKAAELDGERLLLAALERLADQTAPPSPVLAALQTAAEAHGAALPQAVLVRLAAALEARPL